MRYFLVAFLLCSVLSAQENAKNEIVWLTDYQTAIEKANTVDKNIVLYFTGSDWCPPCKRLKKDFFETKDFQTISEEYVLLYIDMPKDKELISPELLKHNKQLYTKYNTKGAVPLLKIIDSQETELGSCSGYAMNGNVRRQMNLLEKHK